MADNYYDDRRDNLTYKDSWLQNTVELAALGTILTGAATLATTGDLRSVTKGAKRVAGVAGKGFDNYMKRKGSLPSRFGYQVGKKTFLNLKKTQKPSLDGAKRDILSHVDNLVDKVDNDPEIRERLEREAAKRLGSEGYRDVIRDGINGTSKSKDKDLIERGRVIYQKLRDEEIKKINGHSPSKAPKDKKNGIWGSFKDGKPLFNGKEVAQNAIGSGLTGLAFGAGLSGFHAIDRMSSDKDNQKKLEDSFQYAGSFLNQKDDGRMKKQAGSLETYNRFKEVRKKFPEAVATGLGFTGVSLGAAKVMNDSKEKKDGENGKPKGTRVIIELGDTDAKDEKNLGNHPANALSGLPKLSSIEEGGLAKLAFRGRKFVEDFKGHTKEIDALKERNHADVAASQLKDQDVKGLVKNQYGNLVNDKTEAHFTKSLHDSKTQQVKKDADDRIRELETRTADARLKVGAGAVAAGGLGLAGLANRKGNDKDE